MRRLNPSAALKSIFRDEQWLVKTGMGGMTYAASLLLLMLSFFTLPLVIVLISCAQGYLLRTIRAEVASPNSLLPDWGNPVDLFMSGLTWVAIQSGLLIVTSAITVVLGFVCAMQVVPQVGLHFPAVGIGTIIIAAVLWLFMWFSLTFLMVNFAIKESNTAGFAFSQVLKRTHGNPADFLAAWITGEGLKFIAFWLPIVTVFGAFLLPSTLFIAQIAAAKLVAQAWGERTADCAAPNHVKLLDS